MVPATKEQTTALQILRTSSSIDTPEKLAAVIKDESVPRYCQLDNDRRMNWMCDQLNALNYMTHSSKITSEIDLLVEASMIDKALMDDDRVKWLTQVEMQEAFLATQRGSGAAEADAKLKRESSIENIKLVVGL